MITTFLQVALGGAFGAMARFGTGLLAARFAGPAMPLGVLTANLLGCLAMGLFVGLAGLRGWTPLNPLVATGFLGGFTTFSSFSLEAIVLMQRGQGGIALLYVGLSVLGGLAALWLGLTFARALA